MEQKAKVLVVDDEQQMRLAMETVIARQGHSVFQCTNGLEALELLDQQEVDLVITDMKMPEMGGEELLRAIRERSPRLPVVMITAYGTIGQAVDAMKNGAFDFITKPFSAEDLESVVGRVIRAPEQKSKQEAASGATANQDQVAIVTKDPSFKKLLEIASVIAQSSATVLVQGESGTGKELIARLIHATSPRSSQPFVAVNCAAVPGDLLESELFGHEKGSFTGASGTKIGKFQMADGGTILLDEVSEMDQTLQAKLLRVLQEREIDRVGGQKPIPVDVRVVATTNRDLRQSVEKGEFREDLYYRLNVVPLFVPALRERQGDVKLLAEHFVRQFATGVPKSISSEVFRGLEAHPWPGNVRELQNASQRAVLLSQDEEVHLEHFLLGAQGASAPEAEGGLVLQSGMSVAEAEKKLIFETLKATNNNKTRAAELLGISIRTLRNKLNEYDSQGDGSEL